MATRGELSYEVFISEPIPFSDTDRAPNGDRRMFQPISSTLIVGPTDAVLVDPPMTIAQTDRVATWVEESGKRLTHIGITHGHGDHWFGTAPLLRRFKGATAYAAEGTIEVMRMHAEPGYRAKVGDSSFPNQIPDTPVLATTPPGGRFELEGHELRIVDVGHSDTDKTTVVHVPSIGLVVAGDVIYNGYHQYLAETRNGGLQAWMKAVSHTALESYNAMVELYPDRLNPSALWFWGAKTLFES